uniref:Fibroblast growth factor 18 n=1 Tax=Accipiter nisus TaxID=211598 RepID=A0A8B9M700_9AVES
MLLLFHGLFSSLSLLPIRSQMFAAEENVDFRIHVENQTRARDDVSRKQLRLYQLYSRTSGKHIQVLGRRISAKGEDGDKYAQLLVETDTFGSQVRIKGKETDFYLCMNRKGNPQRPPPPLLALSEFCFESTQQKPHAQTETRNQICLPRRIPPATFVFLASSADASVRTKPRSFAGSR